MTQNSAPHKLAIKDFTEGDCVAKLLEMYKELTEKNK